ncbi:MAG: MFS transporter [Chloroflexi bacterium]|nr:MFS transporter [Chloroflexota bacterium]
MSTQKVKEAAPVVAEEKLDFKKVLPIFIVVMVDLLGLTIIIPLLPLYAASLQISPFLIGVLNAVYPVAQLIGAPILGRLSDRYGRKPVLIASQVGTLIGFILLGFANTFVLLLVSRLIDGFSGGNISTAQAMMADSTTEKTRTQGLGLIGAAFGLGFTVGPVIAFTALALSGNNYRAPAFIAALFSLASVLLSIFWLKETQDPTHRNATPATSVFNPTAIFKALGNPQVGLLLLLAFAQQFAFGGFENVIPLFNVSRLGLNASGNALVFVFVGIIVVAIQGGLIGRWSRQWGERKLIFAGLALLTIALALTALTPAVPTPWYSRAELQTELHATQTSATTAQAGAQVVLPAEANKGWGGLAWLLLAMIPASVGGGILQPSINSLITKRVTPQQRGEMLGTSAAMVSAANVFAPLVGFALFQTVSISSPFWLWAAVMALLFIWAIQRLKPGRETVGVATPS